MMRKYFSLISFRNDGTLLPGKLEKRPEFCSGWKFIPAGLKFAASVGKYIVRKKKYPLFLLKSLNLFRNSFMLPSRKFVKFDQRYYYAILGVPHWPSPAFDRMVAKGGLNFMGSGTPFKSQVDSVILAISRKCQCNCQHCYEYENLATNESVPLTRWQEVVRELQEIGVSIIVFSGGEPMLRYEELLELLQSGNKNLSDFQVHSSGHGVTPEKAVALKKAGLDSAAIGIDDFAPESHDRIRGRDGSFNEAVQALNHFRRAGIFTYANVCLRKELVANDYIWKFYQAMKDLQVGAILLLEPKPYGGYFHMDVDAIFSNKERETVTDFYLKANRDKKYKDYPLVSYMAYFESPDRFGCHMGGLSHLYISSTGDVQPCIFLPVTFGTIMDEDFSDIYKRMRKAIPGPLNKQCPANYLAPGIKAKHKKGAGLPIPFNSIKKEWQRMFA